ncbi:MAG: carbohydrate ABC transporter permease [Saccharofermentanales bacterium]
MGKVIRKRINRSIGGDIVLALSLLAIGLFMAIPMIYAIGNAFKPLEEFWVFPPHFLPRRWTLQNFTDLSVLVNNSLVPLSRYVFNTVFITLAGTGGLITLASMCAYPFAKKKFPGQKAMFSVIVTSLMFSPAVTSIPNYLVMSKLNLIDNPLSIIIPAFGLPIGFYLMKQFMEQMVPDTVLESAGIDGAAEYQKFWIIVMPIVRPAWLTLIIFAVQMLWGSGSNVMIFSEQKKTLAYALGQIASGGLSRAGAGGAVGFIMMSVPIAIFLLTQSNIIETMSTSGIKDS